MKVAFFSNYFNSHQLPLALEFEAMEDVDYTFVSLLKTEGVVGRDSLDYEYPFVLREYEGSDLAALAMRHAVEDDVVVFGDMAGKEQYVKARAKTGKLFFRYAERLLKRGDWWRFAPPKIYRTWDRFTRYKDANMYVLCASAYTAPDLAKFGFPTEKCLKWGYFPMVSAASNAQVVNDHSICSVQRLVSWKHVDVQLRALSCLKKQWNDVHLTVVGDGPERERLWRLSKALGVDDVVCFTGELTRSEVFLAIERSTVFVATSNRREGWGATVNEAMSLGCCVVASKDMGCVPFLINDGEDGLVYSEGPSQLAEQISQVFRDSQLRDKLRLRSKSKIEEDWNAAKAALRLVEFYLSPDEFRFKDGLLSASVL